MSARRQRHGHSGRRTPTYASWRCMTRRCRDQRHPSFPYYGGRTDPHPIQVCERWRDSFAAFLSDVGKRPSRKRFLDRIDNNGDYEPGNVRWATRRQQARNRRKRGGRIMTEYSDTSIKILGRGMARRSLDLIEAMAAITEAAHPITGRGVGYKLFIAKLISSMAPQQMQRVYRLLKQARERGIVPWHHIVDEAREFERAPSWNDPEAFATVASQSYRRDSWNQQPVRCEVWSEKGTVRGVLEPVLDALGVGFRVMHGFSSATIVHDIAEGGDDGRKLIALYVGDWDPSGMYMSERDLPQRLEKYYGWHVEVKRIALTRDQVTGLPSFPATDKRKDPRFEWFRTHYGIQCWEIDALDPNVLRAVVEEEITALIEPNAWKRCEINNAAEQETLRKVLTNWANPRNSRRRK